MSRPVSRPAIIRALLGKEARIWSRDLVYLALTVALLVVVPVLFRILPDSVDETITLGVSPSVDSLVADARAELGELGTTAEQLAALDQSDLADAEGLALVEFATESELTAVVEGSRQAWRLDDGSVLVREPENEPEPEGAEEVGVDVGIAFPEGFIADVARGEPGVRVTVYSAAAVPPEIQTAMAGFVRELSYQIAGRDLPVTVPAEDAIILGEDRVGDQPSLRERMRPLLLFMMLLMETFSMAALVSTEVVQRTVSAVLVTPARIGDVLAAKAIFGSLLSLGQALVILALIGGVTAQNWSLLLVALVIGAMMFTGLALLVGAAGKDFMGQLFLAMLGTIPLLIPAFAVLLPGSAAPWVRVLPTYPVVDLITGAMLHDLAWADAAGSLAYATGWLVVLFAAGWFALKRKVLSL